MRRATLLAVLLALLASIPSASAAAFELGGHRIVEHALQPGEDVAFEVPVRVLQEGWLYAKLLATEDNAVHDGLRANGSVADATGWRVSYALVRADGARVELGARNDSQPSELVEVVAGETLTFVTTVHVAEDAADGGPNQRVYVALAYRANRGGAGPGGASGASMDEARALTFLLSDAHLPPAQSVAEVPEAPPVEEVPTEGSQGRTIIVREPFPTWLVVLLVGLGVASIAINVATLTLVRRALRAAKAGRKEGAVEVPLVAGVVAPTEMLKPRE